MLKLHFKDHRQPPLWIVENLYSIGSSSENQLVLADPQVEPIHAHLIRENDKFFLKDNNSRSGSFVNGRRIAQREIVPGDILRIGASEIIVLDSRSLPETGRENYPAPWRLVASGNWLAGKQFVIFPDKNLIIGRGNKCDIVIPGTHLSRRHAEVMVEGNHLRIRDLGSANGTFLNEIQIANATANNGDILRLDVYSFRVVAPDADGNRTRLRKPLEALVKPVARKELSREPKRWITRPTSPGNRAEPSYPERSPRPWLLGLAALVMAGVIASLLLW